MIRLLSTARRISHHPVFYGAMAGLCLQDPSSAYSRYVGRSFQEVNHLHVVQIFVGILFLVLFVKEIRQRARR
jgi:hypothetical protein